MVALSRADDIRYQNRSRVLSVVRNGGAVSRTDISDFTGLSAATVSAITSDFIDEGVLIHAKSADVQATARGRPKVALSLNPSAALLCAVYFQLNSVTANLVDYSGETVCEFDLQINQDEISAQDIKRSLIAAVKGALGKTCGNRKLSRIAVGFQGVTDVSGQDVLWTPICKERDMPVAHWLRSHFKVPVRVANDCDMIVQGLHRRDPERFGDNFAALLLAHGVGMGLYLRDSVVNGTRSSGIEFGHMNYIPEGALCRCGNRGCIEAYSGDYALHRQASGLDPQTPPIGVLDGLSLSTIANAADAGDKRAVQAISAAGDAIGKGLANLFALVDPFPVVLVGRGAIFFERLVPTIRAALAKAPGTSRYDSVEFSCFLDDEPLVRDGCAITALLVQDEEMAKRRSLESVTDADAMKMNEAIEG